MGSGPDRINTILVTLVACAACSGSAAYAQQTWHVDPQASGPTHDGLTWCTAFVELHTALETTESGDTIRVAGGLYRPDPTDLVDPREATFTLVGGVTLSGGYAGCRAPAPDLRDLGLYESILSGDIGGDDVADIAGLLACISGDGNPYDLGCASYDRDEDGDVDAEDGRLGDNSYHVVTGSGVLDTTVLDGFTIASGNADGGLANDFNRGGGVYNLAGAPTVTACLFRANYAEQNGGGMYNADGSAPHLTSCAFRDNACGSSGGAMFNWNSAPELTRCALTGNSAIFGGALYSYGESYPLLRGVTFRGNTAAWDGGAMHTNGGSMALTNCLFTANVAGFGGGGVCAIACTEILIENCTFVANQAQSGRAMGFSSAPPQRPSTADVANCVLWNGGDEVSNGDESDLTIMFSDVQGSWEGEGNIDIDPLFVDAAGPDEIVGTEDDNTRLLFGSSAVNAGDPGYPTEPDEGDLDGHTRVRCGRVDMGAYENGVGDHDCDQAVDLADFAAWHPSQTGWSTSPDPEACDAFDYDRNGFINLADFAGFQRGFTGSRQ